MTALVTTTSENIRIGIWVVFDDRSIAVRVEDALRRRGMDSSASRFVNANELNEIEPNGGVYLLCIDELTSKQLDLASRIRGMIGPEATLVAVSNPVRNDVLLRAVRAGINDFLFVDETFDSEVNQMLSRTVFNSGRGTRNGRVVSVLPSLSAMDANLISVNFAALVAEQFGACGLLDFQFRTSCQSLLLNIDPCHTIADLVSVGDAIDESMFLKAVTPHESGIRLLAGPNSAFDIGGVTPQACERTLELAKGCWPISVVNCEDIQHADQNRLLGQSDDVILCTRMEIASLSCAQRHLEWLNHSHVPRDRIHVIALDSCEDGPLTANDAKILLKNSPVTVVKQDVELSVRSINLGNPLVRESPTSRTAAALRRFTNEVLGLGTIVDSQKSVTRLLKAGMVTLSSIFATRT